MTTVILILSIFNTGLLIILTGGVVATIRKDMIDVANKLGNHIDESIENGVTALYNMDTLKWKAENDGKVEV